MKKRLLVGSLGCVLVFSLAGCSSEAVQVNVSNSDNISSNQFGQFIDIGDGLVYDSATRMVYIEDYTYMGNYVHCPYYAPNGLPYRYNPETNTFEEIEKGNWKNILFR